MLFAVRIDPLVHLYGVHLYRCLFVRILNDKINNVRERALRISYEEIDIALDPQGTKPVRFQCIQGVCNCL